MHPSQKQGSFGMKRVLLMASVLVLACTLNPLYTIWGANTLTFGANQTSFSSTLSVVTPNGFQGRSYLTWNRPKGTLEDFNFHWMYQHEYVRFGDISGDGRLRPLLDASLAKAQREEVVGSFLRVAAVSMVKPGLSSVVTRLVPTSNITLHIYAHTPFRKTSNSLVVGTLVEYTHSFHQFRLAAAYVHSTLDDIKTYRVNHQILPIGDGAVGYIRWSCTHHDILGYFVSALLRFSYDSWLGPSISTIAKAICFGSNWQIEAETVLIGRYAGVIQYQQSTLSSVAQRSQNINVSYRLGDLHLSLFGSEQLYPLAPYAQQSQKRIAEMGTEALLRFKKSSVVFTGTYQWQWDQKGKEKRILTVKGGVKTAVKQVEVEISPQFLLEDVAQLHTTVSLKWDTGESHMGVRCIFQQSSLTASIFFTKRNSPYVWQLSFDEQRSCTFSLTIAR